MPQRPSKQRAEQSELSRQPSSLPAAAPRLTPLREAQLVEAASGGDTSALAALLEAYQRRIYSICYRMLRSEHDARDLTQDAMVKLIEGLHTYDGRAKLSTWVIRVTMNCCLSHLRKQKLRRHGSLDLAGDGAHAGRAGVRIDDRSGVTGGMGSVETSDEAPGLHRRAGAAGGASGAVPAAAELSSLGHVEQSETHAAVLRGLSRLEPEVRAILVLRDVQDLEYETIAEVLEVPVGTVKSRLFRAREALRKEVESDPGFTPE